ncbi:MAG: hypothetical protein ACYTEG_02955 [Planctomycetota bacterium]|jgi:hypothetical protein
MRILGAVVLLAFLGVIAINLRSDDRETEVQRFGERIELLSGEAVLHRTAHDVVIGPAPQSIELDLRLPPDLRWTPLPEGVR